MAMLLGALKIISACLNAAALFCSNEQGIILRTGGKAEFKAGQHVFVGGKKVSLDLPQLNKLE
ncbi:hypothetical protein ACW7EJ_07735, partial [Acinetobacter soli]